MPRLLLTCLVLLALGASACSGGSDSSVSAADTTSTVAGTKSTVAEIAAGADQDQDSTDVGSSQAPEKIVADGEGPGARSSDGGPSQTAPSSSVAGAGQQAAGPVAVAVDDDTDLGEPAEVVAEIRKTLDRQPVSGAEVLDAVEPLDDGATTAEVKATRDRRAGVGDIAAATPRNETGELVQLDEAAALACADVERALTAIDEGEPDKAFDEIESAATRAGDSDVAGIAAWSETLDGAWTGPGDDFAVLLGFLSSCTKGGYEL